ncbi:hypothetical protein C4D60_Mb07t25540 [Musa balbisiana]|uniref:PA domain-containing protein n=1 Tax=Musa balbisiana TaxID=52838 RepID=A0A4S8JHY7_MUSBA|nr:hypothetical protein C4D60_Mb07t25540 [Musa balbisiana]
MGVLKFEVVGKFALFAFLLLDLLVGSAGGDVVLIGRNVSLSFPDIEATFAPSVKGSGECGVLYVAEPLDACAPLTNEVAKGLDSPFALIIRGGCTFDVKVRNAQNAGFKAAIVYDNEDRGALISKFHAFCVDFWLTTWRTFCPVCKQDARAGISNLPASECTPLLSSGEVTISSNVGLSSFRSSMAASPALQIFPVPSGPESNSQPHLLSGACSPAIQIAPMTPHSQSSAYYTAHIPNPHRSYGHSPAFSTSRSSLDLRNASSQRSHAYLLSSHSLGFPRSPSINSRLGSSYIPCSSNVSSSYLAASSSQQSYLRHCTESGASLSALASAQSLPGC